MTLEKRTLMLITIGIMSIGLLAVISPVSFVAADNDEDDDKKAGSKHVIEMSAVEMPDGLFAYKMDSHTINGKSVTVERYGADPQPSIPGPTIIIDERDEVELTLTSRISCENWPDNVNGGIQTPSISHVGIHVHGVHYMIESDGTPFLISKQLDQNGKPITEGARCDDGSGEPDSYTYNWFAAQGTAGTWPYHDHTLVRGQGAEDFGLFGTLIINEKYTECVNELRREAKKTIRDHGNPVFRTLQILEHLRK